MSLDSIHADGIEDGLTRWAANPGPDPGTSFRTVGFLGAGLKALPAAAFDVGGAAADAISGFTPSLLATGGGEGFSQPGQQDQAPGLDFDTAGGNALRRRADEFSPDPLTAHAADQVLHGLVRFGAKAGLAVGTMGPAGALLLGAEETENETQRLRAQGVDTGTAVKVGAVQGVASAAGAVMPLGGKTILQTLGLVAAGGPGMFMGQEALSKKILQSAGQNDQASLHNPFDPLGLAVSTVIPGAFGALHVRSVQRTALERVVEHIESGGQRYGKDGELLTSPKGAQGEMQVMPGTATDPGFGVTPAQNNSPEELARVGRDYLGAMANRYGDSDKALAAYNAGPGAVDKAIAAHGDDWLKNLPRETQEYVHKANALGARHAGEVAAQDPANVDAARVAATDDALTRSLPDTPDAVAQVQRAADIVAEDGGRAAEQAIAPGAQVPRAGTLSAQDTAIESRLANKLGGDLDAAVDEYGKLPDSMGGKVLNTDVARELSPDYIADRTRSAAVHEPSSWFIKQLYDRKLAELQPGDRVLFTSGGTGAGKTSAIENVQQAKDLQGDAAIIYDTNMNTMSSAVSKIDKALAAGAKVEIMHVQRDPVEALVNGALPRAMRQERQYGSGRTVPLTEHGKTHRGAAEVIQQITEKYADNPNVEVHVIDNTRGKGGAVMSDLGFVRSFDYNGTEARLYEALQQEHAAGRISDAVFRSTAGQELGPENGRSNGRRPEPQDFSARPARADNALPDPESVTLAGDKPPQRGEELGSTQREAAKQTAEAGKPAPAAKDPEARARDIELLQKRRTVLQSLLDCLEAA